ncbi:MAG: MFS transporter [Acidimicrobiia bacterium]
MTDLSPPAPARLVTARFGLVVTCGFLYFFAIAMVMPVIPHYVEDELGLGKIAVGVGVGAFAFGAVILRTYAGRIGDRAGRRILIIAGALIVAFSTVLYGVVDELWWLVVARIVSGIGEAAFFVGAATMITDLAPAERRGEAISYWSISVYGGITFGPAFGDFVAGDDRYGLTWAVSAAFALAAGVLALFTRDVPRDPHAQPYARLIYRAALLPGVVLFLGLIALGGYITFLPLYADDELDVNVGLVFLLYGALILGIRIFGARIPDRLGGRTSATVALAVSAIGVAIIAAIPSVAGLLAGTIVFAVGMSLMYPALLLLGLSGVPDSERAAAIGTISSFFDLSQGIGPLICGVVAASTGDRGAFAAGAVAALAGLVVLRASAPRPDASPAVLDGVAEAH